MVNKVLFAFCASLLFSNMLFAQRFSLSQLEDVEGLRSILEEMEDMVSEKDPGVRSDVSRRRLPGNVDEIDTTVGIIEIQDSENYNPFMDIKFSVRLATTFFWDIQDQSTGIGYQVIPSLRFNFGTVYAKHLQYRSSGEVRGFINVDDFRISGFWDNSTLGLVDTSTNDFKPVNQEAHFYENNYLIPVFHFGDIDAGINFYGAYFIFSSLEKVYLGEDDPYSVRIRLPESNVRYGRISETQFLNDFGGSTQDGVRNFLGKGPQFTLGYAWKDSIFTSVRLVFPTVPYFSTNAGISFNGENFDYAIDQVPDNLKNLYAFRYQVGLLPSNEWVRGLGVFLGYAMAMGGSGGLGGISELTNRPIGLSLDVVYNYELIQDMIYLKPLVGTVLSFKTSTNSAERALASRTYLGIRLGWVVDYYDDGTPYYQKDDTYDVESLLDGNPIFGRNEVYGGLTATMSYTEDAWIGSLAYFNFRISVYEDTAGGFIPGLGVQLSYEAGQVRVGQNTDRHALAVYLDGYVFHNIRVYGGILAIFAGEEPYVYQDTFSNVDDHGLATGPTTVEYATVDAQAYLKFGVLFEEVFPYTSFIVEFKTNDLVGGYVGDGSLNPQRAGALTLTALAQF